MSIGYCQVFEVLIARGYEKPQLRSLTPDSHPISLLMLQPKGSIEAGPKQIRWADVESVEKSESFLRYAIDKGSAIVVTPEYSLPRTVLEKILACEYSLPPGALWLLGTQSLSRSDLEALRTTYSDCEWLVEDIVDPDKSFFDPIFILFNAKYGNVNKLVVVVQFKCQPMSESASNLEHINMFRGKTRYLIGDASEIQLLSLICSDTLEFRHGKLPDPNVKTLFVHIQMNNDPCHPTMTDYRQSSYKDPQGENYDYIVLNWAAGTVTDRRLAHGGTAIHTKADKASQSETQLEEGHRLGAYYTYCKPTSSHIFWLNYNEHVFDLTLSKLTGGNDPAFGVRRSAPKVVETLAWEGKTWVAKEIDDGFESGCQSFNPTLLPLIQGNTHNKIQSELLLLICAGKLTTDPSDFKTVESFRTGMDEVSLRLTVNDDTRAASQEFKERVFNRFIRLRLIIAEKSNYPRGLQEIAPLILSYPGPSSNKLANAKQDRKHFTVCYLGEVSPLRASKTFEDLKYYYRGESNSILVWFRDLDKLRVLPERVFDIAVEGVESTDISEEEELY